MLEFIAILMFILGWNFDDRHFGNVKYRDPANLSFLENSARRIASINTIIACEIVHELDPDKLPLTRYGRIADGLISLGQALEHDAWNNPYRILGDRPRIKMFDFRSLNVSIRKTLNTKYCISD